MEWQGGKKDRHPGKGDPYFRIARKPGPSVFDMYFARSHALRGSVYCKILKLKLFQLDIRLNDAPHTLCVNNETKSSSVLPEDAKTHHPFSASPGKHCPGPPGQ
ncbi:hypothetical protein [Desulfatibacillum alkenivorans]|jgi:hypothetical protein|uniref:hypothetical protein n=1 Tax=Desulfatibacillum alkenivorans TaxID=259354 RepID=UPI001114C7BF|nr:hypothetical protein [Desulfatibacillum alkenivorans]